MHRYAVVRLQGDPTTHDSYEVAHVYSVLVRRLVGCASSTSGASKRDFTLANGLLECKKNNAILQRVLYANKSRFPWPTLKLPRIRVAAYQFNLCTMQGCGDTLEYAADLTALLRAVCWVKE
jgi:hypothetical protein